MKAILSLRKQSYLTAIGTFLILAAMVVGAVSCAGGPTLYELTMAVNPPGIGTATDETDMSPYAEGAVVDIIAHPPDPCYQFVGWTAPAGTFADEDAATTTFTMPARDVTVTANFELASLDHFKGYWVDPAGSPQEESVILEDQFGTINAQVREAELFCNPTEKLHGTVTTPISNPENHLTIYNLLYEADPVSRRVEVTNQFGTQNLTVYGPVKLAVPTQKVEAGSHPPCVDFEDLTSGTVYSVTDTFTDSGATMTVKDFQWSGGTWTSDGTATVCNVQDAGGSGLDVNCNNVNINFDFGSPLDGLSLLYGEYGGNLNIDINGDFQNFENFADIDGLTIGGINVAVTDLGAGKGELTLSGVINSFDIGGQELWVDDVCPTVPYEPSMCLDHYLLYDVIESPSMEPVTVVLNDQFEGEPDAQVLAPRFLANPVKKTHGDEVTDISDPDTHLVFYSIEVTGEEINVDVEAKNQFGDQNFVAFESAFLAVPSEKTVLPPPALGHFRGYWVDPAGGLLDESVILEDQFHAGEPISATVVYNNWFFCNPVEKWIDDWHGSPIWHPDHHLYIYGIHYATPGCWDVEVSNQFGGAQLLTVYGPVALAVPTQKEGHGTPVGLDHYLLYTVIGYNTPVDKSVYLVDQFIDGETVGVTIPAFFANPVQKTHGDEVTPVDHYNAHLVFYDLVTEGIFGSGTKTVNNQFGAQEISAYYPGEAPTILGVPSLKLWWESVVCPP